MSLATTNQYVTTPSNINIEKPTNVSPKKRFSLGFVKNIKRFSTNNIVVNLTKSLDSSLYSSGILISAFIFIAIVYDIYRKKNIRLYLVLDEFEYKKDILY